MPKHEYKSDILFILKYRDNNYGGGSDLPNGRPLSSGLRNSVKFVVDMLQEHGIKAHLEQVVDNNCIDREVAKHRPKIVIIEAYWVVPEKFDVLKPLHPDVHWIVRNHSETPFLASEGIAFGWSIGYLQRGVEINCNTVRMQQDLIIVADASCLPTNKITYLPNYYPIVDFGDFNSINKDGDVVNVGCFGAVRPLKNHLVQAVAAISFAQQINKKLNFHINSTRVEGGGDRTLRNLQMMFTKLNDNFKLIEHGWLEHDDFIGLLRTMHFSMQVSFSETFNIVTSDAVTNGVPCVVSDEISWMPDNSKVPTNSANAIASKLVHLWSMYDSWRMDSYRIEQLNALKTYCYNSIRLWTNRFGVK